jgi:hypothetical protein
MRGAVASSTRSTYDSAIRSFKRWRADRTALVDAPATAQEVISWLAALADGGLRHSTLNVYKSALHTRHQEESHPDGDQRNPLDSVHIKRVLAGIANSQVTQRRSKPLSAPLFFSTLSKLSFSPNKPRDVMLLAAASLGVTATMRPSEIFGNKHNPERALTLDQLQFFENTRTRVFPPHGNPTHIAVHLRQTKTHPQGATKYVSAPDAIASVWRWISDHRRLARPSDLIFTHSGRQLTTNALVRDLERRHIAAGFGQVYLTGKCFRRGGASTLAAQGIDAADIASLGWAPNSPMWQVYANDPAVQLYRALALGQRMQVELPSPTAASS